MGRRRPLIGITTSVTACPYLNDHDVPFDQLPHTYATAVRAAGGEPMLIPEGDPTDAQELALRLDGLLLAGGRDVDPGMYGQARHPKTVDVRRSQDEWESALFKAATRADLPVLGICRGHQLMCICSGGTLHQHLPDLPENSSRQNGGWQPDWPVVVQPGTMLAACLCVGSPDRIVRVKIGNHQAVATSGTMSVAARSAADGLVEAAEDPSKRFCLSVQWHPEYEEEHPTLVSALVAASRDVALLRSRVQLLLPLSLAAVAFVVGGRLLSRWT